MKSIKKMKNNKIAFTLVEVLAVIVILGILAVIIAPTIINTLNNNKESAYDMVIADFKAAANEYVNDNRGEITELESFETLFVITLGELEDEGYLELPVVNPKDNVNFSENFEINVVLKSDGSYEFSIGDFVSTKPTLALNGDNPDTVACHASNNYTDPGAEVTDPNHENVPTVYSLTTLALKDAGSYSLGYSYFNDEGAYALGSRTINITNLNLPVITIEGGDGPLEVYNGDEFIAPNATATDVCEGDIEVTNTSTVDTDVNGSYTVTYTATNLGGTSATKDLTVNVVDAPMPPVVNQMFLASTIITGYQRYTVPYDGDYTIELAGGCTGNYKGALMKGDFTLEAGDELLLMVGTDGPTISGAGGSFVAKIVDSSSYQTYEGDYVEPLIVAGGASSASDGLATIGTTGLGGTVSNSAGGGGGGGFVTNGANGWGDGGRSFLNGGRGGESYTGTVNDSWGGYGGGGGYRRDSDNPDSGGGGGGYDGGNAGYRNDGQPGNSYNDGTNQLNTTGGGSSYLGGDGYISIRTKTIPSEIFYPSITTSGYQNYIVPETGTYRIVAIGAGNNNHEGALMEGDFNLTAGDELLIMAGRVGGEYSGSGGTFVAKVVPSSTYQTYEGDYVIPLIVAGGATAEADGLATIGTGLGGEAHGGGGGGGFAYDGGDGSGAGGRSFLNGGAGGAGDIAHGGTDGAYGGGGGEDDDDDSATKDDGGGSGGFDGGDGDTNDHGSAGNSYNAGANQNNVTGGAPRQDYPGIARIYKVSEMTPPQFSLDPIGTEPTVSEPVEITIDYSPDSTLNQYKIGDGTWINYVAPFSVTSTTTVYARSYDYNNYIVENQIDPGEVSIYEKFLATITTSGYQTYTIPHTGTYSIEAHGGSCSNSGALIKGEFSFTAGDELLLMVGNSCPGTKSGAGGTFVAKKVVSSSYQTYQGDYVTPLLVAAGATWGREGNSNLGSTGLGGANSPGGGGFSTDGYGPSGGKSFLNGGAGGIGNDGGTDGAYGGGAGEDDDGDGDSLDDGGGSGGYNGGNGVDDDYGQSGLSYNTGTNQYNVTGGGSGGKIIINYVD